MILALLFIWSTATRAAPWPGVQRVHRDGRPTNYAAQSVRDMIKSGVISVYALDPANLERDPDETIDLSAKDEFVSALAEITARTHSRVTQSASMRALLSRPAWTMNDRVNWEKELSQIASEERHKIPGLKSLRSTYDGDHRADRRPVSLNELSIDIRHKGATLQFICEQTSAVDGIVLQRVEDAILKGGHGLKAPASYLRVTSFVFFELDTFDGDQDPYDAGNHVYLMSPATGNIIETTADPLEHETVYRQPMQGSWSTQDYLSGHDLLVHADHQFVVYSTLYNNKNARDIVSKVKEENYITAAPRLEAELTQDTDNLLNLLNAWNQSAAAVALTEALKGPGMNDDQLRVISTALHDSKVQNQKQRIFNELRIFKNRMVILKYLEGRLVNTQRKANVARYIADTQSRLLNALNLSVCDAEIAHIPADSPVFAVKETLSGGHKLRVPVENLDASERLPWKRAVSCMEDAQFLSSRFE